MSRPDDNREPLTARQAEWLQAVRDFYARAGTAPTLQKIGDLMGVNAVNTGAMMLRRLARKGYLVAIESPPGTGRFKYIPADRTDPGAVPAVPGRTARFVAELRREAAELRKRAAQLERIAAEMESDGRQE